MANQRETRRRRRHDMKIRNLPNERCGSGGGGVHGPPLEIGGGFICPSPPLLLTSHCEGVQKRPRSGRPATNGLVPETWESREKMHLAAPVGRPPLHPPRDDAKLGFWDRVSPCSLGTNRGHVDVAVSFFTKAVEPVVQGVLRWSCRLEMTGL